MAYALKSTGLATKLVVCVLVDDDGTTIVDLCRNTVTPHANVTIHDASWKGTACKVFRTPSGGSTTPNGIDLDQGAGTYPLTQPTADGITAMSIVTGCSAGTAGATSNPRTFIKIAGGTATGLNRVSSTGGGQLRVSTGGSVLPPTGSTAIPTDLTTKFSLAGTFRYNAASCQVFYGLESGSLASDSSAVNDVNEGNLTGGASLRYIGGIAGQNTLDAYHVMSLVFDGILTESELQAIHNDPFGTLIAGAGPTLSIPIGTATGSTTATIGATTDTATGTLYGFVSTSATPPSAADLKAGTGATWSGSVAVSSTGAKTLSATGLTAGTGYYAHLIHTDGSANDSNIVTSAQFTTTSLTKKLKLLAHADAQGDSGVAGVVFDAPTGSNITGPNKIGEFTGKTFEASLEGGKAVLKVPVADFGGSALTTSSTPVALVRNTTNTTGIISCTVIEE